MHSPRSKREGWLSPTNRKKKVCSGRQYHTTGGNITLQEATSNCKRRPHATRGDSRAVKIWSTNHGHGQKLCVVTSTWLCAGTCTHERSKYGERIMGTNTMQPAPGYVLGRALTSGQNMEHESFLLF